MGVTMSEKPKKLSYVEMGLEAVLKIKVYRVGASRMAIRKYIETNYGPIGSNASFRKAVKKLVDEGTLTQKGQRFRLEPGKNQVLLKGPPNPKKKKKPVKKKTKTKKKATKKKKKKATKKATKKKATKKK